MAEPYKVYQRNLNIPDAKENFFVMQKLAFRNFTNGLLANASRIQDLCRKETHKIVVKVIKIQNEFSRSSFTSNFLVQIDNFSNINFKTFFKIDSL